MEKLTIIIPTYERQTFMLRAMHYWSGKEMIVIFLDGSKVGLDINILANFKSNIKYIHSSVGIYKRILSAISLINTEYIMFGCDDEFYIPSALESCLIKLSLDSNLVACAGRALRFNWNDNSVLGYNVYRKLKNLILDDINPMFRLYKHFSNYVPAHVYSICRTSVWKVVAQEVFSREYNFYAASELQLEFLLVYAGKTLIIPELMWMRSDECPPHHGTSKSIIPSLTFHKWWFDENNIKEKEDFIARMEIACKQISKINKKYYDPKVQNVFEIYLKSERIFILFKFYKHLPNFLRNMIKSIYKIFGYDVTKKTLLIDAVKSLENTGVKVNFTEIKLIERLIYFFYQNHKSVIKN